jgi:beta-glucosidase
MKSSDISLLSPRGPTPIRPSRNARKPSFPPCSLRSSIETPSKPLRDSFETSRGPDAVRTREASRSEATLAPIQRSTRTLQFLAGRAFLLALVFGIGLTFAAEPGPGRKPPCLDPDQPIELRVQDLIARLTLEEKAIVLNHRSPDIARLGIKSDKWNQCLNGVKWDRPTTLFPACIAMSATWNTNLIHDVATALSDEARAIYNGWHRDPAFQGEHKGLIYRAPVINIGRNPYWGRNHEAWGEDPFLTGRMAVAYVTGLQGDDPHYLKLAATLKHFAVNNVETDRTKLDAKVPERWLHEYWLPHFRDAVIEGKACSLMASYNAINGTPNQINRWLLTDLLKREWGHEGFVVSDLGGVKTMVEGHENKQITYTDAVARSIMAGCDFSDREFTENIPTAVREGKLTEDRLNDALTRVLRVRFRLGEFDPPERVPYSRISTNVIGNAAHRALALQTAQQSIVLLQNQANLLPFDQAKLKRVAIIGPLADRVIVNNYNGKYPDAFTPLQGFKDRLGPGCEVTFATGAAVAGARPRQGGNATPTQLKATEEEVKYASDLARNADAAIVFVGTDSSVEQEGHDRKTLTLTGQQEELVKSVLAVNPRTVVVLMSAGPLTVPWLKEHAPAMLQAWWPGEEGGHAIADVVLGNVNPAGRLPHTVYASESQVPPSDEYDISQGFTYLYLKGDPLFPFGHGLSYTRFQYSNLRLTPAQIPASGKVLVSCDVKNTGKREGDEVVQLYIREVAPSVKRAAKELRGFQRLTLQPGEEKTVCLEVPGEELAFYDEKTHRFVVNPGAYDFMVGSSSADIRLRGQIKLK